MKTIKILICLLLCLNLTVFGQQTCTSSGGDINSSAGSVSFSIGQVNYITSVGSGGSSSQGVQQVYDISVGENSKEMKLTLSAFPNPIMNYLLVKSDYDKYTDLNYMLFDAQGRIQLKGKFNAKEIMIDLRGLISELYILKIFNMNEEVSTIKIIKE